MHNVQDEVEMIDAQIEKVKADGEYDDEGGEDEM